VVRDRVSKPVIPKAYPLYKQVSAGIATRAAGGGGRWAAHSPLSLPSLTHTLCECSATPAGAAT
jgi:hypothetical protein